MNGESTVQAKAIFAAPSAGHSEPSADSGIEQKKTMNGELSQGEQDEQSEGQSRGNAKLPTLSQGTDKQEAHGRAP